MRQPFIEKCPVCGSAEAAPVVEFPELAYGRCQGCGLIYKREQQQQVARSYDEQYFVRGRAKYLKRWEHRVRKNRRYLESLLEYAPHATSMLDIGCSAGYVLAAAKSLGLEEMGLDYSEFTVQLCREKGLRAQYGTMLELPFADASFDLVTIKHALEHVTEPLKALAEIHRVLRPGGVALVVVPDAAYWKISVIPRHGRSFRPEERGWQHHVYFFAENLVEACSRAGLVTLQRGKAIYRHRKAGGLRTPFEAARFGLLSAWVGLAKASRWRKELYHVVRKPPVLPAMTAA